MPALNSLAAKLYDASTTFADRVHFVHVYVIEPHPKSPDPSPYRGTVWEQSPYSTKSQPRSYPARVANAAATKPDIQGNQLQLVDDLTPGRNNPVWCTYGTCPNCAFLIRRDGTIHTVQTWVNATDMETALRALLGS